MQSTHFFYRLFCAHLRDLLQFPVAGAIFSPRALSVSSCQVSVRCSALSAGHDFHTTIPHLQHSDFLAARRPF